jgi:hypothetical protein
VLESTRFAESGHVDTNGPGIGKTSLASDFGLCLATKSQTIGRCQRLGKSGDGERGVTSHIVDPSIRSWRSTAESGLIFSRGGVIPEWSATGDASGHLAGGEHTDRRCLPRTKAERRGDQAVYHTSGQSVPKWMHSSTFFVNLDLRFTAKTGFSSIFERAFRLLNRLRIGSR